MSTSNQNAGHTIRTIAPTRIDICGGTLDIWPLHQIVRPAATVNIGVTLHAEVQIMASENEEYTFHSEDLGISESASWRDILLQTKLPLLREMLRELWDESLPALKIQTSAQSPAGAGLGGSSCLGIALARALLEARHRFASGAPFDLQDHELVALVSDIEARLIWAPTGVQDYWGGLRGRVNILRYPAGGVEVHTLSPDQVLGLEEQLILCFSGKSRASADNNWKVFSNALEKNSSTIRSLEAIADKATQCAQAVEQGDLATALLISKAEWEERKKLWPDISTEETHRIESAALSAGAYFARVCGAGGGGVISVFAPPAKQDAVKKALVDAGGVVLDAEVAKDGLQCFHETL